MRTFIAIELSEEIRKKIWAMIEELKGVSAPVKWVEQDNLHITLKFLGEVPDKEIDNLISLSTDAAEGVKPFAAEFAGVGTFPGGHHPRVIWVDTVKGREEQGDIASSLEEKLSNAGFRSEEREFKPHITVGRVREDKGLAKLLSKLEGLRGTNFGEMKIDHVNIMKSRLSPKGPTYEIIKSIRLEQ